MLSESKVPARIYRFLISELIKILGMFAMDSVCLKRVVLVYNRARLKLSILEAIMRDLGVKAGGGGSCVLSCTIIEIIMKEFPGALTAGLHR